MSDRIVEIEARLNAATPGPWEATHRPKLPNENDPDILAARRDELGGEPGSSIWANEEQIWGSLWPSRNGSADANFIAHSPSDVAYLLAELRKRDEALARVEAACDRVINNEDGHKPPGPPHPTQQQATALRIRAAVTGDGA